MQTATKASFLPFDASTWQIGIVVAQFNRHITDKLLESALLRSGEYGLPSGNINTLKVAGTIELPLALQNLAESQKYQALVAIGCVIRGDTPHFDYVCKFATEGILRVQLDWKIPIAYGILTCENEEQALARADLGGEYLDAALQMAKLMKKI